MTSFELRAVDRMLYHHTSRRDLTSTVTTFQAATQPGVACLLFCVFFVMSIYLAILLPACPFRLACCWHRLPHL